MILAIAEIRSGHLCCVNLNSDLKHYSEFKGRSQKNYRTIVMLIAAS